MRRGENKILLLARRQYFSNVTFLCSDSEYSSSGLRNSSPDKVDDILEIFCENLKWAVTNCYEIFSHPAPCRCRDLPRVPPWQGWLMRSERGTRHITRRIKEDTIVHNARIEEIFTTFQPADSLQWWIKKPSDSKNVNWNIDWTTEFEYIETEPEREERVNPLLCRPGLSSEHVPHVPSALLSLPHQEICRINEWEEMQRQLCKLPGPTFRGNLPNINHSTWRKSQEIENPSAKYADRLDFIELFDRCPRQFKIWISLVKKIFLKQTDITQMIYAAISSDKVHSTHKNKIINNLRELKNVSQYSVKKS